MTARLMTAACIGASVGALVVAAAGCASPPEPVRLDDVVAERAGAREAADHVRFTEFMAINGDRFVELDLELPRYQGLVAAEHWADEVDDCVERVDAGVSIALDSPTVGVTYFGTVGDVHDRIHWVREGCIAQYGLEDAVAVAPGPVEARWLYNDTVMRLVPCLRGLGLSVPSVPRSDAFARSVAAGAPWNPVALAAPAADHARVSALCPSSTNELERRIPASVETDE